MTASPAPERVGCDRHGADALLELHGRTWACVECADESEGGPASVAIPASRLWPLYEICYGRHTPSHEEIVKATSNRVIDHSRNRCTCWIEA